MIIINDEKYIDLEEVANLLKIGSSTVRIKVKLGEIPQPHKLPSYTYWKLSEIEKLKNNSKQ